MAREASGRVWLAVTGRLAYPYVIYESDVDNATLDDPEEAHSFHYYLFFVPESVVLYNISTGQIYGTWNLTESGSTADRIATLLFRLRLKIGPNLVNRHYLLSLAFYLNPNHNTQKRPAKIRLQALSCYP